MTWSYEVTHNEDGTFSVPLPDGDELRIIPPKREWVGLTEDETDGLIHSATYMDETDIWHLVSLVEERLKEKNGG